MPIGIATERTMIMAPKTSDAVIGAARKISSFTDCRVTNDCPSEPSKTRRFRNAPYWMYTGSFKPEELLHLLHLLRRRGLARGQPRRVRRYEEEDHVGDERDGDEEHDRPQEPTDEIAEHVVWKPN